MKQVYFGGLQNYFLSWSNIVSALISILFIVSLALKYFTINVVTIEKAKLEDSNFWFRINSLDENDLESQKDIYQTFYWLNSGKYFYNKFSHKKVDIFAYT